MLQPPFRHPSRVRLYLDLRFDQAQDKNLIKQSVKLFINSVSYYLIRFKKIIEFVEVNKSLLKNLKNFTKKYMDLSACIDRNVQYAVEIRGRLGEQRQKHFSVQIAN